MNQINLNGRRAVVTGAAQGIGLAIVERFLASGASVSLWDRDNALLKETVSGLDYEGAVHHMAIDVTDAEGVAEALKQTERAIGGIDIMINNAGIAGPIAPSWEYPVDAWREVIEVDLNGVFFCCRAVLPGMRERNYGRIVNVASIAGKEGNPNAAAYSAAKAGVIALTKSLAKETADLSISINCVTPAPVKTRIFDQITQEHIDYMLSKVPRGRFLEREEAAAMIAWMASEENSYTTGAAFDLSGGRATY